MIGIIEALKTLKAHIYFGGVSYLNILDRYHIPHGVGLYIAKSILVKEDYLFTQGDDGNPIDIEIVNQLSDEIFVKAPFNQVVELFGFQSSSEVLEASSPAFTLLNQIANMGVRGCTTIEIGQIKEPKNVHILVDKLLAIGVVIKRAIYPLSPNHGRIKSFGSILHLKKYSHLYNAEEDNVQILPDDDLRDRVFAYVAEILDAHQLQYLPTQDMSRYFNLNKRFGQYFRNLIVMQQKLGNCILDAEEKKCAPLKTNLEPGLPRMVWCIKRSTVHDNEQGTSRIRNVPLTEQVDLYTRRRRQFSVGDIRKYTATHQKRAQKIMNAMTSAFNYSTIRVQDGRVVQNKLIPKEEVQDVDKESEEENVNQPRISSPDMISACPSSSSKALMAGSSTSKRSREDECNTTKETIDELKHIVGKDKNKRQFSLEQEERLTLIINYLRKQYHGVGSVLEVSQLLRTAYREKVKSGTIDKKTIMRMISILVDQGLIEMRTVDLDESQSENFGGGMKQVDLMILKDFHGDKDSRIEEYLNSYVHIKTVYRKKDTSEPVCTPKNTSLIPSVGSGNNQNLFNTLDLDALLRDAEANKHIPGPRAKRPRKSKVMNDIAVASKDMTDNEPVSLLEFQTLTIPDVVTTVPLFSSIQLDAIVKAVENDTFDCPQSDDVTHRWIEKKGNHKSSQSRDLPTEGYWTHAEDLMVLSHFVENFFVRKAGKGLPDPLKPIKLKKLIGVKSTYVLYPWASVTDSVIVTQDLLTLRPYYWGNAGAEVNHHSISACKARIHSLMAKFSSFSELLAYFLWETSGEVNYSTFKLLNFILQRKPPTLSENADRLRKVLGRIFQLISRQDPFELSELLCKEEEYDKLVLRVLRELYLHSIVKSQGIGQQDNNAEKLFGFCYPFLNAASYRPLGMFLNQIFDKNFEEIQEWSGFQHWLYFIHLFPSIRRGQLLQGFTTSSSSSSSRGENKSDHQEEEHIFATEIIVQKDRMAVSQNIRFGVKKDFQSTFQCITHEEVEEINSGIDRIIMVEIDYSPLPLLDLFNGSETKSDRIANSDLERELPWFNKDGYFDQTVFKFYTKGVVTYLTDYPKSTLNQIHAKLMFLPLLHVKELLKCLVEEKVLKVIKIRSTLRLNDPFGALKRLKDYCTKVNDINEMDGIEFYSLNIS